MYKKKTRIRRALCTRNKIKELGSIRLVVYRTSKHIYAQIISFDNVNVLVTASTLEKKISKYLNYTGNKHASFIIGKIIALRSIRKGITNVSFDRSGFKYHGRIKVLADSARKFGLNF